jgi:catechol 2,3-dioxygenase-like lactoylglutathione lyase family enzyme/predicted GNAT family N-acyltransferase
MRLIHRPAGDKDIPVICGFPQSAEELFFLFPGATYPLTVAQLKDAIAQRSDPTVVEADHKVVGFADFHQWAPGGRCTIGNVIVAPAARGRGIGRCLIQSMIELAHTRHQASEVGIACFNGNIVGLLLYAGLGFRPYAVEERKDYQGNRAALIHMVLRPNRRVAHLAVWAGDLERLKAFYVRYFGAKAGTNYVNAGKRFQSCFLTFSSGMRLELMHRPDIPPTDNPPGQEFLGYAHLAVSVGSEPAVDALTRRLVEDGYRRLDGPRWTGDGYYESVILDPEGNRVEITV